MVKPLPAVNAFVFLVTMVASNKSPFAVVVRFPVLGVALFPCAVAGVPSSELLVATPEYSKIAKRKVPKTDCATMIVSGPPLMFSA